MSKVIEFKISCGIDFSIHLQIDQTILTPEYAADIAAFWGSSADVLDAADGNTYEAVARYAATRLWYLLMDGYHAEGAVAHLHDQEGWCIPGKSLGIVIVDHEVPDLAPEYLEVSAGDQQEGKP